MALVVPNIEAITNGVTGYDITAVPDTSDWAATSSSNYVVAGCAVTQNTGSDMKVQVAFGSVMINNLLYHVNPASGAAPAVVQTAIANGSGTSVVATFGSNPTPGNMLVGVYGSTYIFGSATSTGDTWAALASKTGGATNYSYLIAAGSIAGGAGDKSVTANLGASGGGQATVLIVYEIAGYAGTPTLDVSAVSNNMAQGPVTPNFANEFVIACITNRTNTVTAPTSPWIDPTGQANPGVSVDSAYQLPGPATPSALTATFTGSANGECGIIAAFLNTIGPALTIGAASSTDRRDIIVWTLGTGLQVIQGTPCATSGWTRSSTGVAPVKPAIPPNSVLLAEIAVPAGTTAITNTNIVDKTPIRLIPPGQVLARVRRGQGIGASTYTTTSSSAVNVDGTNLLVTFIAPPSGDVVVDLEGVMQFTAGTAQQVAWLLMTDASTVVANTVTDMGITAWGSAGSGRLSAAIPVTGLTPGNSYTFRWGWLVNAGQTATLYYGQTSSAPNEWTTLNMTVQTDL